jgi:hypothetical protein
MEGRKEGREESDAQGPGLLVFAVLKRSLSILVITSTATDKRMPPKSLSPAHTYSLSATLMCIVVKVLINSGSSLGHYHKMQIQNSLN